MAGGKSDCRCMEITIPHILLCTKPPAADCRGLFYEILSLSFILGFLHHIIQRGYPCAGSAFGLKGKGRRITPGRACDIQVYPWFPSQNSRINSPAVMEPQQSAPTFFTSATSLFIIFRCSRPNGKRRYFSAEWTSPFSNSP